MLASHKRFLQLSDMENDSFGQGNGNYDQIVDSNRQSAAMVPKKQGKANMTSGSERTSVVGAAISLISNSSSLKSVFFASDGQVFSGHRNQGGPFFHI